MSPPPSSPYRIAASRPETGPPDAEPCVDADLWSIFLVLWVASIVRVALAFCSNDAFGAEATLALLAIPALPLLMSDKIAALGRRLLDRTPRRSR